jgi:hypothetical protein
VVKVKKNSFTPKNVRSGPPALIVRCFTQKTLPPPRPHKHYKLLSGEAMGVMRDGFFFFLLGVAADERGIRDRDWLYNFYSSS